MIAEGTALAALLPQQAPFVMIDCLLAADEQHSVSGLRVPANSVLLRRGRFSEAGLVENMAQTAAAGVGYRARQRGHTPPVGYIAAIRQLRVWALPAPGTELRTTVAVTNQVLEFSIVQGTVRAGTEVLAEAELRIFLKS